LSVCSTKIRLQGQIAGSTVVIFADGQPVAKAEATGPDEFYTIEPGLRLEPRAHVTATQDFGGETSDQSLEPVIVQARPRRVGRPIYASHLWEGCDCFLLVGLVPGAEVTVRSRGGTFTAQADDGTATVYRKPLAPGEVMEAVQAACGETGPTARSVVPEPLPLGFANIRARGPLQACQTEILVQGTVDGGHVTVERPAIGETLRGCFPLSEGLVTLGSPLQEGEELVCKVELPQPQPVGESLPQEVGPRPPEPTIDGPLCAGATTILVKGLARGTRVALLDDGTNVGACEAPTATFQMPVPPLRAGAHLRLEYEFCGDRSTTQAEWEVAAAPASLSRPVLSPVSECSATVRVTRVRPGTRVHIFSEQLDAPIGDAFVPETSAVVQVAPALMAGDRVRAVQSGCGRTRESEWRDVRRLARPQRPVISPLPLEGERHVTVTEVELGANVDLYVDALFAGSAVASESTVAVGIVGGHLPLLYAQKVFVRESICAAVTDSVTVPVQAIPPTIHVRAVPEVIDPGQVSTLVWRIDNADFAALDGVEVAIDGFAEVRPTTTTTYELVARNRDVMREEEVVVEVRTVPTPPPPPRPLQAATVEFYNCHSDRRAIHIWQVDLTAGGGWQHLQTLDRQGNGGCPGSGSTPFVVTLTEGHQYQFIAVDPENGNCAGRSDPNALDFVGDCMRWQTPVITGAAGAGARVEVVP